MALYKRANFLTASTDVAFDAISKPGEATPYSGI